jgi:hypothetical protein
MVSGSKRTRNLNVAERLEIKSIMSTLSKVVLRFDRFVFVSLVRTRNLRQQLPVVVLFYCITGYRLLAVPTRSRFDPLPRRCTNRFEGNTINLIDHILNFRHACDGVVCSRVASRSVDMRSDPTCRHAGLLGRS